MLGPARVAAILVLTLLGLARLGVGALGVLLFLYIVVLLPMALWQEVLNPLARADASGPEDATRYTRPSSAGRWLGYVSPTSKTSKTTCGLLLRNQRLRNPRRPVKKTPQPLLAGDPMRDPWLDG